MFGHKHTITIFIIIIIIGYCVCLLTCYSGSISELLLTLAALEAFMGGAYNSYRQEIPVFVNIFPS